MSGNGLVALLAQLLAPSRPHAYITLCGCMMNSARDGVVLPFGDRENTDEDTRGVCPLCMEEVTVYEVTSPPFGQLVGDEEVRSALVRRLDLSTVLDINTDPQGVPCSRGLSAEDCGACNVGHCRQPAK